MVNLRLPEIIPVLPKQEAYKKYFPSSLYSHLTMAESSRRSSRSRHPPRRPDCPVAYAQALERRSEVATSGMWLQPISQSKNLTVH